MTDSDTALMLAMLDELNAADIGAIVDRCHEDVVAEPVLARAEGGAFVGHDGMRRWYAERDAAWETIRTEATSPVRHEGGHMLVDVRFTSHARGSGVDIDVQAVIAGQRLEDKFSWWAVFPTEDEAIARIREREAAA